MSEAKMKEWAMIVAHSSISVVVFDDVDEVRELCAVFC